MINFSASEWGQGQKTHIDLTRSAKVPKVVLVVLAEPASSSSSASSYPGLRRKRGYSVRPSRVDTTSEVPVLSSSPLFHPSPPTLSTSYTSSPFPGRMPRSQMPGGALNWKYPRFAMTIVLISKWWSTGSSDTDRHFRSDLLDFGSDGRICRTLRELEL